MAKVDIDLEKIPSAKVRYHLGFTGPFGDHLHSPRSLASNFLGKLVCVEGIVTKCMLGLGFILVIVGSLVRPKVLQSIHFCPATKNTLSMEYRDASSLSGIYPVYYLSLS